MDDALETIQKANDECMNFVCAFIKDGWKDTLAKLLVYVGTEKADETLAALPQELAEELSKRKAALGDAKPSDGVIAVEGAYVLKDFDSAAIVSAVEKLRAASFKDSVVREKCERLFDANPFLLLKMQNAPFTFEDFTKLDDHSIQRTLRETRAEIIARALQNASEETRDKFFRNMHPNIVSKMNSGLIRPAQAESISAAQKKIIDTALDLAERGEVVIFDLPDPDTAN